jgi:trigger factor
MHITKTVKTPNEVELTISAVAADLSSIKKRTLTRLAPEVKLAGFRAGKVPLNLIEKNIDQTTLQSEFLDAAVNALYQEALNRENLRPVANPEVALKKFVPFTDLEFVLTVPVIGDIKLPDYTKVRVKKEPVTIDAKQVNDIIVSLQKRMAERKLVERAAKDGDEVTLDFKGVDDKGEAVNGAEGKDYPLLLGSNAFIPGFETNVVGVKPGESKTFIIPFPKDYGVKALQGKKVSFTITATVVTELVEPKVDDDFAAKAGPFKTVAELKEDIKKQLIVERQNEANRSYEEAVLKAIADKTSISVPKQLADEQIERIENEERQNLMYRGQTWEEHLVQEGVSAEEHQEQKRPAAEERVKVGIILSELAEAEKISVTPEEFEIRLKEMRDRFKDAATQTELEKPEVQRDLLAQMMTEKTIAKLVSYAQKP